MPVLSESIGSIEHSALFSASSPAALNQTSSDRVEEDCSRGQTEAYRILAERPDTTYSLGFLSPILLRYPFEKQQVHNFETNGPRNFPSDRRIHISSSLIPLNILEVRKLISTD